MILMSYRPALPTFCIFILFLHYITSYFANLAEISEQDVNQSRSKGLLIPANKFYLFEKKKTLLLFVIMLHSWQLGIWNFPTLNLLLLLPALGTPTQLSELGNNNYAIITIIITPSLITKAAIKELFALHLIYLNSEFYIILNLNRNSKDGLKSLFALLSFVLILTFPD